MITNISRYSQAWQRRDTCTMTSKIILRLLHSFNYYLNIEHVP